MRPSWSGNRGIGESGNRGIGESGEHRYQVQLGTALQRCREHGRDLRRPQVLVLDVDQVPGLADGLGVSARHASLSLRCERVATCAARIGAQQLHRMMPGWFGVGMLRWQRRPRGVVVPDTVREPTHRAAAESVGVFPAFTEHRFNVAHGRSADGELDVVPRRSWPEDSGHRLWLRIAPVRCAVAAAVAQVDASEEGDIEVGPLVGAQDDELLVVRPSDAHPHVKEAFAASVIDLIAQMPVLRGGEGHAIPVGAPYEASNVDAASSGIGEHLSDLRIRILGRFAWSRRRAGFVFGSEVPARRSLESPRQSTNISRSPSRICDTR
jgi:hypothetical protein